jgi:hypothetical protein
MASAENQDSIKLAGHVRLLSARIEQQCYKGRSAPGKESSPFSKEKFRPMYWTRLVETAMPDVGVLERKGVKSHAEGEGVYSNDRRQTW